MADNSKLDLASSTELEGAKLEENRMGTQKISVLDHINEFQYTPEKSGSFVIDMESFSNGGNKDIINNNNNNHPNSRITRNFSRKGSQRGGEKKINSNASVNDRKTLVSTSSPRGPSTPEKAMVVAAGTTDHPSNLPVHHQITITTGNINATTEGRCTLRRNSFKRSQSSWALDPKRILFFFATLSSMGTMLLIYFTLSISKMDADGSKLD